MPRPKRDCKIKHAADGGDLEMPTSKMPEIKAGTYLA